MQHTRKLLVTSVIHCHDDYVCSSWFEGLTQFLKNNLETTENKSIRFMMYMDSMTHVGRELLRYLE